MGRIFISLMHCSIKKIDSVMEVLKTPKCLIYTEKYSAHKKRELAKNIQS